MYIPFNQQFLWLVFFSFSFLGLNAQVYYGQKASEKHSQCTTIRYNAQSTQPVYARLKNPRQIPKIEAISWVKQLLHTHEADSFNLLRTETDELGYIHERYQQYRNGFPVLGGVYSLHYKDGYLSAVNGVFFNDIPLNTIVLSEQTALATALQKINAQQYKWEIPAEEVLLKQMTEDAQATYYPKGTLVYAPKNYQYQGEAFRLAYEFNIYAHEPHSREKIYVDASNGEIILSKNLIHTIDSTATAHTKYSGIQSMKANFVSTNNFNLQEAGRCGIATYNLQTSTNYGSAVDFTDNNNIWNNVNANQDEVATDCHWGSEMTYDYYKNTFGRLSYDNANSSMNSYVHYSSNYVNAFWNGSFMTYGDGSGGYTPLTCLDVVGHEITHGVTQHTADLDYYAESGALNESFSDIFGKSIEHVAKPSQFTWIIGKEMTISGGGLRSMSNPNVNGNPDTYFGSYWYKGTGDNAGVHTNSGVQNFWYYLLCQGGSGTNDLGKPYNVTSLGFSKAEKIAYRNLSVYLTSTSQYEDARFYALESAADFYGYCSFEYNEVGKAWFAVGVGDDPSVGVQADFTTINTDFCRLPVVVDFSNLSNNGTSYLWNFGNSTTSTLENPSVTYTANGNYTVKLITEGPCGKDTLIKTTYININTPATPTVNSVSVCKGTNANLVANVGSGGVAQWYTSPTGGTPFYTGTNYTETNVTANKTYYVAQEVPKARQQVGPVDSSFNTGAYNNFSNQYLVFDVYKSFILDSITVFPSTAGSRTFEIRNSANTVLASKTVNLGVGKQTIALGLDVPIGTNLRLGLATTTNCNLYHNDWGASYPYTVPGIVSITSSSVNKNKYYFFYNWKVTEKPCVSQSRTMVTITNINPPSLPTITASGSVLNANTVATSYQWFLNGNTISGATNNTYTPTQSGVYSVIAYNGTCASSSSANFTYTMSSIADENTICATCVQFYPNPVSEQINLSISLPKPTPTQLKIIDVLGQTVWQENIGTTQQWTSTLATQFFATGVYQILVQTPTQTKAFSFVKQ